MRCVCIKEQRGSDKSNREELKINGNAVNGDGKAL